jgi:hypothetical protein
MPDTVQAIYLQDGYAKDRGLRGWYRDLTVYEAKQALNSILYAIDKNGKVRECRINSSPKTWKTFPGCELSIKYGYRECFRVGGREREDSEPISKGGYYDQVRIVVPVKVSFTPETPAEFVTSHVLVHELPVEIRVVPT